MRLEPVSMLSKRVRSVFCSLAIGFGLVASAAAQIESLPRFGAPAANIKGELLAATDAVVPGQPLLVGLRLVPSGGWYTYWQVPGDAGLPTQIAWQLPPGFSAGPIEWPHPQRLPLGPMVNFGYKTETMLLTTLSVPQNLATGGSVTVRAEAKADWLECKDVCIPGGATLTLTLPVRESAKPSSAASLFAAARALVPQPLAGAEAQATLEGKRLRLALALPGDRRMDRMEFYPLEAARIEPSAAQILKREGTQTAVYLTAATAAAPDFKTLKGVIVANGGPAVPNGWTATVEAPVSAGVVAASAFETAGKDPVGSSASMTLLIAFGGALLGGLILNLMPCVFPVLSLKLIGLSKHRTQSGPLAAHGLAFTAGVVLSFVLLAALLLALQQTGQALGWGFQLQTPWVIAALTILFFVIGLNLLSVFEFTFGQGVANSQAADALARKSDWRGSFGTGVLAVIVASPCKAPFMGAALGYAITQPPAVALSVFAALGVGMALPYLLLTLFPRWLARLPRPGRWMEIFKQLMAFPMFATCVWLLWVLMQQVDAGEVALALGALVAVGFALWALGLSQRGASAFRWVALSGAVVAALTFTPIVSSGTPAAGKAVLGDGWIEYSRDKLVQLQGEGRPVFVDFTAAWCVTCQVNKRTVLDTERVSARFAADGVVLMRADWTNRDERITQALAEFGRNGVPLYVLYDRSGQAAVLPQLLTPGIVFDALDNIK